MRPKRAGIRPRSFRPAVGLASVLAVATTMAVASYAQELPAWPDTYVARLQALALVETLNAEVLASRSATLTLESWCRDHQLAKDPAVVAELSRGVTKAPTAEQRQRLQVTSPAEVKYRRVQLRCGNRILSEADNWYVPDRLTAAMNRLLDTTGTPFGKVVQPLEPYRQTFEVRLLWSPLPDGWERGAFAPPAATGGALTIPDALFEHRAVLYTGEHKPFSEVDEVYQRQLLAFPAPRLETSER
jgi:chorismate-pyruvate lyase